MECGVAIGLNPHGGNQLNVRELLRRLHPEPSADSDDGSDAGGMEDMPGGGGSAAEREVEPRRLRDDEYDYDDDFIDDAELVEEEEQPLDDGLPYDESADEDFKPEEEEEKGEEGTKAKIKALPPVHHGFGRFFVNKGDIPSKALLAPLPNPPDSIGNVSVQIPGLSAPTPPPAESSPQDTTPVAKPSLPVSKSAVIAESSKKPSVPNGSSPSGSSAPASSPAGPPIKKQKPESGGPSKSGKVIPAPVLAEIIQLEQLCREEFGDKKPKTGDAKVQDRLAVFFREALKGGVARLFSDIAKDRRLVALNDEVWQRLSRFIRTKRATIEGLGHALHWRAKEIDAKSRVTSTEARVDQLLEQQRAAWPALAAGEQKGPERPVTWGRELDERLFDWYRARADLQLAKNQLGARVRSVKKSTPGWVGALKNRAFAGFAVGDQEVIDAFRRIEEERAAVDKQKREAERAERKRKKEQLQAAAVAKKVAIANAKGAPTPAPAQEGSALPANADAVTGASTVVNVVPKPKSALGNGGQTKNSGASKNGGGVKNSHGAGKHTPTPKPGAASKQSTQSKSNNFSKPSGSAKPTLTKSVSGRAGITTKSRPVKSSPNKVVSGNSSSSKVAAFSKKGIATLAHDNSNISPHAQKQTKLTSLMKKDGKLDADVTASRTTSRTTPHPATSGAKSGLKPSLAEKHSTAAGTERPPQQATIEPMQVDSNLASHADNDRVAQKPNSREDTPKAVGGARSFEVIELD